MDDLSLFIYKSDTGGQTNVIFFLDEDREEYREDCE